MTFEDFLNQAWNDHGSAAIQVAERLETIQNIVQSTEQLSQAALLITHVYGEHLGKWNEGIKFLSKLEQIPFYDAQDESARTIYRCKAVLALASGTLTNLDNFSISDQVRILAFSASALSGQNNSIESKKLFREAVEKTQLGLDQSDPANRSLAMAGNNLAAGLEEKLNKSEDDINLMLYAAKVARKYWEISGTWLETERAEYRLAKSYLSAKESVLALKHAQSCLEIAKANKAEPLEIFFGYEALALAERANGNLIGSVTATEQMKLYFDKLTGEDKKWCENSLTTVQNT